MATQRIPKKGTTSTRKPQVTAESPDQSTALQKAVPTPKPPNWEVWGSRHKATVFQAVCLALNLNPKKPSSKTGKVPATARAKQLRTHINTTLQWVNQDAELKPLDSGAPINERCVIGLPEFIQWLSKERLKGVKPPAELLSLSPPNPRSSSRAMSPAIGTAPMVRPDVVAGDITSNVSVSTAEQLLPGLLIAYIRDLAESGKPPNATLLSKERKRFSRVALARELQPQIRHRTALKTTTASSRSGLTEESLRKAIAKALNQLNPSLGAACEDA